MSTRRGPSIKPQKRRRQADIVREGAKIWGLGFAGAAERGSLDAYTAEHFEADVAAGVVALPERSCPRHRPELDCKGHDAPHYRSTWRQKVTYPPREPSRRDPNPLPRREWTIAKVVCFDCRCWIAHAEHMAFVREYGSYCLEDGSLDRPRELNRAVTTTRDAADIIEAQAQIFAREQRQLESLVGLLDEPFLDSERFEQANLLANVRHCLARYVIPVAGRTAIRTSLPSPSRTV